MRTTSSKPDLLKLSSIVAMMTTATYFIYPLSVLILYKAFFIILFLGLVVPTIQVMYTGRLIKHQTQAFLVFFLVAFLSCFWGQSPIGSLFQLLLLSPLFFLFYLTLTCGEKSGLVFIERIVLWLPILLAITSFAIIILYGTLRPESYIQAQQSGQATGAFSNLAPALVEACYPFIVGLLLIRKNKALLLISLLASVVVIVISQSRGAIVGVGIFAIMAPLFFAASMQKKLRMALLSLPIIIVILSSLFLINDGIYGHKIIERFESSQLWIISTPDIDQDDYARAVMLYEGVNAINQHPWLGIGFGGLPNKIEQLYGFPIVSHNVIITTWGEMGILGLFSFIWLIVVAYKRLLLYRKMARVESPELFLFYSAALVALTLIFLHGFLRPLFTNPMFYFVLSIAFMKVFTTGTGLKR